MCLELKLELQSMTTDVQVLLVNWRKYLIKKQIKSRPFNNKLPPLYRYLSINFLTSWHPVLHAVICARKLLQLQHQFESCPINSKVQSRHDLLILVHRLAMFVVCSTSSSADLFCISVDPVAIIEAFRIFWTREDNNDFGTAWFLVSSKLISASAGVVTIFGV